MINTRNIASGRESFCLAEMKIFGVYPRHLKAEIIQFRSDVYIRLIGEYFISVLSSHQVHGNWIEVNVPLITLKGCMG